MTGPLISDEEIERALLLQSEEACERRGAARAEYEYQCDYLKELEATLMQKSNIKGATAAQAWARAQPEYSKSLLSKKKSAKEWFSQQEAGNAAQRILDIYRTLRADERRSQNGMGG